MFILFFCRLAGMLGALDTYSSQAVGARNYSALGSMFKQVRHCGDLHSVHCRQQHRLCCMGPASSSARAKFFLPSRPVMPLKLCRALTHRPRHPRMQQAVLFLLLHTIPIALVFASLVRKEVLEINN